MTRNDVMTRVCFNSDTEWLCAIDWFGLKTQEHLYPSFCTLRFCIKLNIFWTWSDLWRKQEDLIGLVMYIFIKLLMALRTLHYIVLRIKFLKWEKRQSTVVALFCHLRPDCCGCLLVALESPPAEKTGSTSRRLSLPTYGPFDNFKALSPFVPLFDIQIV